MRCILLASLAVLVFLLLILVNSFRIRSTAQERWMYGDTMCHLNQFFVRYFYLNTVLHLKWRFVHRCYGSSFDSCVLWAIQSDSQIAFDVRWHGYHFESGVFNSHLGNPDTNFHWCILCCVGGEYVYNPEVFNCEPQRWSAQSNLSRWNNGWKAMFFAIAVFVVPLLVIVFLNWSVYKSAKSQINAIVIQLGSLAESQQRETSNRRRERKAAVDVIIIIAAFLLCFLPAWIMGICHQFLDSTNVPAEVMFVTSCIFFVTSLCSLIIYTIRKKEFRTAIKKIMRQIVELCGNCKKNENNVIEMDNFSRFNANLDTKASNLTAAAAFATRNQIEDMGAWEEQKWTFRSFVFLPFHRYMIVNWTWRTW